MQCPNCGEELEEDFNYCPFCEEDLSEFKQKSAISTTVSDMELGDLDLTPEKVEQFKYAQNIRESIAKKEDKKDIVEDEIQSEFNFCPNCGSELQYFKLDDNDFIIQLKVKGALPEDALREYVKIDPDVNNNFDLKVSNLIEIYNPKSKRKAVSKLSLGSSDDSGKGTIRINKFKMREIDVNIDDRVLIHKVKGHNSALSIFDWPEFSGKMVCPYCEGELEGLKQQFKASEQMTHRTIPLQKLPRKASKSTSSIDSGVLGLIICAIVGVILLIAGGFTIFNSIGSIFSGSMSSLPIGITLIIIGIIFLAIGTKGQCCAFCGEAICDC